MEAGEVEERKFDKLRTRKRESEKEDEEEDESEIEEQLRKNVEEVFFGDFALTVGQIVLVERSIAGFDDERVNQLPGQRVRVVRQFGAAYGRVGAMLEGVLDDSAD